MYKITGVFGAFVAFFAFGTGASMAQVDSRLPTNFSLQINGQIRFAENRIPVNNALVRLESFSGGLVGQITTDRTGKFSFNRLNPIQYMVTVHVPGYVDVREDVNLSTANTGYLNIQLQRDRSSPLNRNDNNSSLLSPGSIDASIPQEAQAEYDKGKAILDAANKDKLGEAITHFEKAASLFPKYLDAHLMLGLTEMDLQKWDKAAKALLEVVKINPEASTAYFALGEVYRRQKKYPAGEKILLEGLKLNADSAEGHLTLAKLYWDMAPISSDEKAFRDHLQSSWIEVAKAIELKPSLADAQLLAGNLLLKARRPQDALTHFEKYLELDPSGAFASETRGVVQKIKKALAESSKQ